ncbi:MAG: AbrB/MazE/SpoVT family DNA-binding domain-containing protein [Thermoplasmataceae archaeon]|jgi:AbrB family looped-hinge helix DNA binding protein|nr:AbrB/MazE/SpoVT family DNA-binding domain-containing protein [Candidatus Thermoplasmatota archaeon]
MSKEKIETEFTKTSSKGQIVIPSNIRKKLNIGTGSLLAVTAQDNLIVLKKISSSISPEDIKTLRLIEEAWEDIDKGKYKVLSKDDFFRELKEW